MNWDMVDPNTNGEYRFLESIAKDLNVAFDIGANVGDYCVKLRDYNPSCKIFAFEPIQDHCEIIRRKGFTVLPVAVGRCPGTVTINRNVRIPALSSIHIANENTVPLRVSLESIDDLIEQGKVEVSGTALMKIDTEGNDVNVLDGAIKTLLHGRFKYIQFEYGECYKYAGATLERAFEILIDCGYLVYHVAANELMPCPRFLAEYEVFRYSNWVAIRG